MKIEGNRNQPRRQRKSYRPLNPTPLDTPCIEWKRGRSHGGYGRTKANGKEIYVHRMVWETYHGAIPDGLKVLHHCDNPPCFNIDHLFLGTQGDNMKDCVAKGRYRSGRSIDIKVLAEIRQRLINGDGVLRIGRELNLGHAIISRIKNGRSYTREMAQLERQQGALAHKQAPPHPTQFAEATNRIYCQPV